MVSLLSKMQWQSESDISDGGTDTESAELKKQVSYLKSLFGKNNDDSTDGDISRITDIEDLFNSNLFETGDLMAYHDRARLEETEFEVLYKEENGRISLAYERLPGIPKKVAEKFAAITNTLDLSYNNIKLNKCDINNLPKWIQRLKVCTPHLKQLSLLGNPGALSSFNGGSVLEHNDYIMYVIGSLESLDFLDDSKISDIQRQNAKTHIGAYTMSGGPMKFMERFAGASNLLTFFKYDHRKPRPAVSNTANTNKHNQSKSKPSTSKANTRGGYD